MLVACRLASLSALEEYYAGVSVRTQSGGRRRLWKPAGGPRTPSGGVGLAEVVDHRPIAGLRAGTARALDGGKRIARLSECTRKLPAWQAKGAPDGLPLIVIAAAQGTRLAGLGALAFAATRGSSAAGRSSFRDPQDHLAGVLARPL
jgi:hypothetical protein